MIRSEAEELFIAAILSGEDLTAVEMSLQETQVFRVLIGRTLKEMEKKNKNLWLKARDYGIEYKASESSVSGGYALIKKLDSNRFKLFKVAPSGEMTPLNLVDKGAVTTSDILSVKDGEHD